MGGGREVALVDGVEREELVAGDESELLGEVWEMKRGGGRVEEEGGSELALVDVVEREELAAGVGGEEWGKRRGGGWVEADGGRELALVDGVEAGNEGGREEARRRED